MTKGNGEKVKRDGRKASVAEIPSGENNSSHPSAISLSTYSPFPFYTALRFWLWLGFVSFGGPAGQIALMHRELVERKQWIDEDKFLHALNFCLLLPGPEAQQLATYNGWRLHGVKGGVAAGAFFVLPSVFVLLVSSYLYAVYGNLLVVSGVLDGLKAIVLAIVVEAVFKIGKKSLQNRLHWLVAFTAFCAIYFFQIPFPIVVLFAAFVGFISPKSKVQSPKSVDEKLLLTAHCSLLTAAKTAAVFSALWLFPLCAAGLIFGWRSLPVKLYLFFTQAAFVTFGGAYAVLVYVNQAAVESFGWITTRQAIDGFALAETTPGPLIMVLQFVGFMAGWNNAPANFNQTFFAAACALLTTFATFLPSFLLVFLFAPFVERLHNNQKLKTALGTVAAAVVGVIATLALLFGAAIIYSNQTVNWFALALGTAAFAALVRFHINVLWLILAGGLIGLGKTLLQF